MDARSVVLAGWYGATNLGDEMLMSTFVDWVRQAQASPTVISVNPAYTGRASGVRCVPYGDLASIVEALSQADLFVLGGGGLFQDYDVFDRASLQRFPAYNVSQFAQFHHVARDLGVPTAVLAQGVGPLRGGDARAIVAEVFQQAALASVRDPESARLLHAVGVDRLVPIAPDPAWTLAPPRPTRDLAERFPALAQRHVVAMILRDWPYHAQWEDAFVHAVGEALPADWGCLWVDFTRRPSEDFTRAAGSEIAERLVPRLDRHAHAVWPGMDLGEAMSLVAACDAVVAMRLHGALLGHLCGLPVVSIEYDDKVRVLAEDVGVPSTQRIPLDALASSLPAALRRVCGLDAESPFVATAQRREQLARNAVAHRAILHDALRQAPKLARERVSPRWLPRWSQAQDDAARARIARVLAGRSPA